MAGPLWIAAEVFWPVLLELGSCLLDSFGRGRLTDFSHALWDLNCFTFRLALREGNCVSLVSQRHYPQAIWHRGVTCAARTGKQRLVNLVDRIFQPAEMGRISGRTAGFQTPARHDIWTTVLEGIQKQVFLGDCRMVDDSQLYVRSDLPPTRPTLAPPLTVLGSVSFPDGNRPGPVAGSVSCFQFRIQPGDPGPLAPPVGRVKEAAP